MAVELVHRLATDTSPQVKKILDNVIFVLVPSLNPDGQIMVTDWFNKNLGTPFENSPIPYLYHPYVGHDNNRDMYMFTQKESQLTAQLLWHDWYPAVWLDEHQMGSNGARIFVMPATDPINPNVHPLIYRWNGILGQSQAAALEAAGKEGIIYNSTYTNFWEGAMAWSGWWHNQIGLLTEVASVRVAAPIEQRARAAPGRARTPTTTADAVAGGEATWQLLGPAAAADRHEPAHRVSAAVDGRTLDAPRHRRLRADRDDGAARHGGGSPRDAAPADLRGEPRDGRGRTERRSGRDSRCRSTRSTIRTKPLHLVDKLQMAGVEVYRADAAFEADGKTYRRGHVRHPDGAGVRALREGHAREADLPRGASRAERAAGAAVRRHGLVAWHAPRRRSRRRSTAAGRQRPAGEALGRARSSRDASPAADRATSFDYRGADDAIAHQSRC